MMSSAIARSVRAVRTVVAPRTAHRLGLRAVVDVRAPASSWQCGRGLCPAAFVPGVRSFASRKKTNTRGGDAGGDRQKALAMALKQVESQFGKGSIMKLGESTRPKVDVISTGSLTLDYALGVGGLPRGRVVEIYGPEASGKTTLALHVIAEAQKTDASCVFIDAEHALDPQYASGLGVNLSELHLAQPSNGEEALEICDVLVRSGGVDVLVVDSVAALVPRAELEGEMGDHHIALQARLMSQALRKLTSSLSRSNTLIIFINQIRSKVGVMFGSPEVTAGGNALKYYSSVRIDIRKSTPLKTGDRVTGNLTKVKVVKNKVAPPFRTAEFDMVYGKGIQRSGELVDLGTQFGILTRAGAWYSFTDSGDLVGQGREKAKAFFEDNPEEAEKLAAKVTEHLRAAHAPLPEPEAASDPESDPESYEPEDELDDADADVEPTPEPEPEPEVEEATRA